LNQFKSHELHATLSTYALFTISFASSGVGTLVSQLIVNQFNTESDEGSIKYVESFISYIFVVPIHRNIDDQKGSI
jgi:hypothetical protein